MSIIKGMKKRFFSLAAPVALRQEVSHTGDARATNAKLRMTKLLREILSRPISGSHRCRFCGFSNHLSPASTLTAKCLFSDLDLIRYACERCGGIYGPIQLIECRPRELGRLYKYLYKFYREGLSTPYQEKTFYLMNPSSRGEYLNYACGDWSEGLQRLRLLNWHVDGYEPFQKPGTENILSIDTLDHCKQYDGLMSHNYVEHVQDPKEFFLQCRSFMKRGGRMAHSSACFEYLYEVSPFHLFFYCGKSVELLCERTGFKIASCHHSDMDLPGYQYICYIFEQT
jgi:hypothetical protein